MEAQSQKSIWKSTKKRQKRGYQIWPLLFRKAYVFALLMVFYDSINDLGIVLSIISKKRKTEVGKQKN